MSPSVQVEGLSFAAIGQTLRIFLTLGPSSRA